MSAQFPAEMGAEGEFLRQPDAFRDWVKADGSSAYPVETGRYHLYVSWACPWAHRTLLARKLMKLEEVIGMTAVDPVRDDRGWAFRDGEGFSHDPINGFAFLSEAYEATDPASNGRYTVPVLWDKLTKRIVSNSDDDIMRMLETEFVKPGEAPCDLYPAEHREEIDSLNEWLFERVNDGVYRAGFATSQAPYEFAVRRLFEALDELDSRLGARRFLVSSHPVESDWRLFVTLIRFDAVYVGHFKCNVRRIADYAHLSGYLRDLFQWPGVAETVKIDQIKRHYYYTHDDINPFRIIPVGPVLDLERPHGREGLR
jgi:putative glutathione S-transferase